VLDRDGPVVAIETLRERVRSPDDDDPGARRDALPVDHADGQAGVHDACYGGALGWCGAERHALARAPGVAAVAGTGL
jgi:hypothetical protein